MEIVFLERLKLFKHPVIGCKIWRNITEHLVTICIDILISRVFKISQNYLRSQEKLKASMWSKQARYGTLCCSVVGLRVNDIPTVLFYHGQGEDCPEAGILANFNGYHARDRLLFHEF